MAEREGEDALVNRGLQGSCLDVLHRTLPALEGEEEVWLPSGDSRVGVGVWGDEMEEDLDQSSNEIESVFLTCVAEIAKREVASNSKASWTSCLHWATCKLGDSVHGVRRRTNQK